MTPEEPAVNTPNTRVHNPTCNDRSVRPAGSIPESLLPIVNVRKISRMNSSSADPTFDANKPGIPDGIGTPHDAARLTAALAKTATTH